jgi:hypothetical protein
MRRKWFSLRIAAVSNARELDLIILSLGFLEAYESVRDKN